MLQSRPVWTERSRGLLLLTCLFGAPLSGCSKEVVGDTGETGEPAPVDADQDGVVVELDCDDNDPALGAVSEDEDCDGLLKPEDCDDTDPASTAVSVVSKKVFALSSSLPIKPKISFAV